MTNDRRAGSWISDGGAYPAARGVHAVAALLAVFPSLRDADVLQIGAVGEGVNFVGISGDILLIERESAVGSGPRGRS